MSYTKNNDFKHNASGDTDLTPYIIHFFNNYKINKTNHFIFIDFKFLLFFFFYRKTKVSSSFPFHRECASLSLKLYKRF